MGGVEGLTFNDDRWVAPLNDNAPKTGAPASRGAGARAAIAATIRSASAPTRPIEVERGRPRSSPRKRARRRGCTAGVVRGALGIEHRQPQPREVPPVAGRPDTEVIPAACRSRVAGKSDVAITEPGVGGRLVGRRVEAGRVDIGVDRPPEGVGAAIDGGQARGKIGASAMAAPSMAWIRPRRRTPSRAKRRRSSARPPPWPVMLPNPAGIPPRTGIGRASR